MPAPPKLGPVMVSVPVTLRWRRVLRKVGCCGALAADLGSEHGRVTDLPGSRQHVSRSRACEEGAMRPRGPHGHVPKHAPAPFAIPPESPRCSLLVEDAVVPGELLAVSTSQEP